MATNGSESPTWLSDNDSTPRAFTSGGPGRPTSSRGTKERIIAFGPEPKDIFTVEEDAMQGIFSGVEDAAVGGEYEVITETESYSHHPQQPDFSKVVPMPLQTRSNVRDMTYSHSDIGKGYPLNHNASTDSESFQPCFSRPPTSPPIHSSTEIRIPPTSDQGSLPSTTSDTIDLGSPSAPSDATAVANQVDNLLRALDRVRNERDELRRCVSFMETESRFTTESRHQNTAPPSQITKKPFLEYPSKLDMLFCGTADLNPSATSTALATMLDHLEHRVEFAEDYLSRVSSDHRTAEQRFEDASKLGDADSAEELELRTELEELGKQIAQSQDSWNNMKNAVSDLVAREQLRTNEIQSLRIQSKSLKTFTPPMEVVKIIKDQIQGLEMRVLRRTEQIGVLQHDIRRFEMNIKLQDDRVSEMVSETETLRVQKDAMVEDCAEAREAKDEALKKLESLKAQQDETAESFAEVIQARDDALRQLEHLRADKESLAEDHAQASRARDDALRELEYLNDRTADGFGEVTRARDDALRQLEDLKAEKESLVEQTSRAMDDVLQQLERLREQKDETAQGVAEVTQAKDDAQQQLGVLRLEKEVILGDLAEAKKAKDELLQQLENLTADKEAAAEKYAVTREAQEDMQRQLELLTTEKEDLANGFSEAKVARDNALQKLQRLMEQNEEGAGETFEARAARDHALQILEAVKAEKEAILEELEDVRSINDEMSQNMENLRVHSEALAQDYARAGEASDEALRKLKTMRAQQETMVEEYTNVTDARDEALRSVEAVKAQKEMLTENLLAAQKARDDALHQLETLTAHNEATIKESAKAKMAKDDALKNLELARAQQVSMAMAMAEARKARDDALRKLDAAAKSGLEELVNELQRRNNELDETLRSKCIEVEEYDDRILETLKVNKKLSSKAESLARKVQNLQSKLDINVKAPPVPPVTCAPQVPSAPQTTQKLPPPPPIDSPGTALIRNRRYNTALQFRPQSASKSSTPGRLVSAQRSAATPPDFRRSASLQRAKASQPPVFHISTDAEPTPSRNKKRPAPDDDERGSIPPEGRYPTQANFTQPVQHTATGFHLLAR